MSLEGMSFVVLRFPEQLSLARKLFLLQEILSPRLGAGARSRI